MNARDELITSITETQRQLSAAKNKLTAPMGPQERTKLVTEVSDCIGRLIELQGHLVGDDTVEATPGASDEEPSIVRERGWWVR